jgi:hypothetical protein
MSLIIFVTEGDCGRGLGSGMSCDLLVDCLAIFVSILELGLAHTWRTAGLRWMDRAGVDAGFQSLSSHIIRVNVR